MPRLLLLVVAAAFGLGAFGVIGGCAYKTEVRQGAPLPEESIRQLREGMSKDEVIALLGPPQSEHLFRDNIWLYYHKKRPAGFSPVISVVSVEVIFGDDGRVGAFQILIDDRPQEDETLQDDGEDAQDDDGEDAQENDETRQGDDEARQE